MFEASRESTIDEQFCYFIVIPYKIITYFVQCKCQSIARHFQSYLFITTALTAVCLYLYGVEADDSVLMSCLS